MSDELKHIVGYELLQGKLLNAFMFPIAYAFRNKVKEGSFLWGFLHEGNLYGDETYRPGLKDGFLKAWLWALRNPLHNKYYDGAMKVKDTNYTGKATCKSDYHMGMWRTYRTETGDRNGTILDYDNSIFGEQDVFFDMNFYDEEGNLVKTEGGFRRSSCMPELIDGKVVVKSKRFGHEHGLLQASMNKRVFEGPENLNGYHKWRGREWITTEK